MILTRIRTLAAATTLAAAVGASAAVAIIPGAWSAAPGADVPVRFEQRAADGYRPSAWPTGIEWMFIRGGGRHWNLHEPQATDGEGRAITVAAAGATMVGAQLAPRVEIVEVAKLAELLVREGAATAEGASAAAEKLLREAGAGDALAVRVKLVECAQAVIRAADGRTERISSPVALAKAGLEAEIRLLMDPTALVTPTDLGVRLYAGYKSCENQRVRATNLTTGATAEAVTDEGGIADLRLDERGAWRIEFARAQAAPDDADADIIIWTCSLGFEMTRAKEGE